MVSWWLILLAVLIGLIVIFLGVYVLFYFKSPEDDGEAYMAKVIVVIGVVLAFGVVLLLPYDVGNQVDPTQFQKYTPLNTQLMWQIMLWIVTAFTVVVVPFAMFYYEAFDPEKNKIGKQVGTAAAFTIVIVIIFIIIVGCCFAFVGFARVPYVGYAAGPQYTVATSPSLQFVGASTNLILEVKVTLFVYTVGILCFLGWIAFCFYCGAGLVAFPIGNIRSFVHRPKAISASRFAQEMNVVAAKADALLTLSKELQQETRGRISRSNKNKINIIRNEVYILEAQQDQLIWAYKKAGGSPFIVFGGLFIGIIALGTSIVWIIHIFIYNTFNASLFLNALLIKLNDAFALFGVVAYGVLSFYLMWATFEGQIALGLRLVFFQIHPMKKHDTMLNSLLFNVALMLLTSTAVIQFCARSFQDYCANTAINALMNVYIINLRGIGKVIEWIQFVLVGVMILSAIFVIVCYKRKKVDPTKIRIEN